MITPATHFRTDVTTMMTICCDLPYKALGLCKDRPDNITNAHSRNYHRTINLQPHYDILALLQNRPYNNHKTCTHTHTHSTQYTHTHTHSTDTVHTHTLTCTCTHTHAHTHTHTVQTQCTHSTHKRTVHTHTLTCTHIDTHIHNYTHTHTHIH